MRRAVIHIGTHKTGTTSIQAFLAQKRKSLRRCGILYPHAGTSSRNSAHHNIAWELGKDQRFDERMGTIDDLMTELSTSEERTIVLSSEDFEYLSQRPRDLKTFDSTLTQAGFSTEYVVLFRSIDGYRQSLYRELVKHGLVLSENEFLVQVRDSRSFVMKESWFFDFDRARFLGRWKEIVGDKVIPYDFDRMVSQKGLLPEFMTLLGASEAVVSESMKAPRLNSRTTETWEPLN